MIASFDLYRICQNLFIYLFIYKVYNLLYVSQTYSLFSSVFKILASSAEKIEIEILETVVNIMMTGRKTRTL